MLSKYHNKFVSRIKMTIDIFLVLSNKKARRSPAFNIKFSLNLFILFVAIKNRLFWAPI